MSNQWKPGAGPGPWPAMVLVTRIDEHSAWTGTGALSWLPAGDLRPMPPTITPEQQAVLDAAERWEPTIRGAQFSSLIPKAHDLVLALRALRAAQQPVDPVAELRRAWNSRNDRDNMAGWSAEVEAAIAAVEKAQKS